MASLPHFRCASASGQNVHSPDFPAILNLRLGDSSGILHADFTAMKELIDAWKQVDRNKIAALVSIVPGLGHLYKHHYLAGFGMMTAGNALMAFITLWLSFATLGLSLIVVPALWFAGVAYSAYLASDEHGMHPWLHVWSYRRAKLKMLAKKS
jgi:hypothetical protein